MWKLYNTKIQKGESMRVFPISNWTETDTLGVSSRQIADELKAKGCDAYYFPSFEEIENFCLTHCQKGDVLITMGAGDVVNIGETLLGR